MIVINSREMCIPREEVFIGFAGDNLHSTRQFTLTGFSDADCTFELYLTFDNGATTHFVLDSKMDDGSTLLFWDIQKEHILKSGLVKAQIKVVALSGEVHSTPSNYFIVGSLAESSDDNSYIENTDLSEFEEKLNKITQDYVKKTLTVAGVTLEKPISVDKLQEALRTYPVIIQPFNPTEYDTVGFTGQLCAVPNSDYTAYDLYVCIGKKENEFYGIWKPIAKGVSSETIPELEEYVKNTLTIAGLELKENVSTEQLQTALNTYPILRTSDLSTTKASVGQLACLVTYNGDGKYTREFYYCYGKNGNGEALWTQVGGASLTDEQIQNAVNDYLEKNPIGVDELQLYSYATRIQNAQTPNTLTLALMADTHYCDNDTNAQTKLDIANKMAMLSNYVNIDAMANLGDFVRGDELKDITRNDLAKLIVNTNQNAKCPVFYVRGNHDDNGWYSSAGYGTNKPDEIINDTEWYQMVFGFTHKDIIIDTNKPNGGYGYFDHEKSKIRVFLLNSSDIPYVLKEDGSYRYRAYGCCAFSNEQLNFVANALQFEDKENPNEWAAMFLTHIPLDTTNDDGYRFGIPDALIRGHAQMLGIINAYRKGISYTFAGAVNNSSLGELAEDFTVSVDADYSEKGVGDVICFVNGHTHTDNVSQKVGHERSLSYGYTYIGLIGATAFATLVVNREDSTVSVFKYGEVKPQSSAVSHNNGAIDGEAEFGIDMSSGQWVVPFEQFRPNGENIYNGLSELWGSGYFFNNSATLNTETLELSTATVNETNKYAITKAIPIKGSTQYEIPNIGSSIVYAYNTSGTFYGGDTRIEGNILTTKSGGGYLVFAFHKSTFPDYENFYIKELINTEHNFEQNALLDSGESDG